jgi:hypothetical protein
MTMAEQQQQRAGSDALWHASVLFVVAFSTLTYVENHAGSGGLVLAGFLLFAAYPALTLAYAVAFLVNVARRRFAAALSTLAGAAILAALPLYGPALHDALSFSIDYARLSWFERHYRDEVERRLPGQSAPRVVFLEWGVAGSSPPISSFPSSTTRAQRSCGPMPSEAKPGKRERRNSIA